jgi:hypothetical protein
LSLQIGTLGNRLAEITAEETFMAKAVGVLLIVAGLVGLLYGGFSYTKRDKIIDLGPIEATKTETKTVPLPPIVGALALIGGVVLVVRREA